MELLEREASDTKRFLKRWCGVSLSFEGSDEEEEEEEGWRKDNGDGEEEAGKQDDVEVEANNFSFLLRQSILVLSGRLVKR